jgi:hypothetical protein
LEKKKYLVPNYADTLKRAFLFLQATIKETKSFVVLSGNGDLIHS